MRRRAPATAGLAILALMLLGNARALDATIAKTRFVGVVLATRDGAPLYEKSNDTADAGPDATWRWASVTKQLTALIVMQDVAAGRLALDEPITRYWPDWPQPNAARITIRMLLQHDSGVGDPSEDAQDEAGIPHFYRRSAAEPAKAAIGYCAGARAEPGSGFHYSNCDYIILGALLERIHGKPFSLLLRERIGRPLGLPSLGMFSFGAPEPDHVRARDDVPVVFGSYGAAGGSYGSPRALLAIDHAIMTHRLLSPEFTMEMWRPDPKLGQAALGAWSYEVPLAGCKKPVAIVERKGEIGGVQIRNFLMPQTGTALAAFTRKPGIDFGEVWQGKGVSFELLSAAMCGGRRS